MTTKTTMTTVTLPATTIDYSCPIQVANNAKKIVAGEIASLPNDVGLIVANYAISVIGDDAVLRTREYESASYKFGKKINQSWANHLRKMAGCIISIKSYSKIPRFEDFSLSVNYILAQIMILSIRRADGSCGELTFSQFISTCYPAQDARVLDDVFKGKFVRGVATNVPLPDDPYRNMRPEDGEDQDQKEQSMAGVLISKTETDILTKENTAILWFKYWNVTDSN